MTINAKRRNARLKYVVQYPSYGCFTIGRRIVRILSRYDTLRTVVKEVREEEKWLEVAFKELPQTEKHLVSEALLDNWNEKGQYLVQLKWYNITSQELSVLCCERYLNDEVINLLINTFCDAANERHGRTLYTMLSSYISTNFQTSAVQYIYANVDMSTVEIIFLPIHLNGNHWGLLVFDVNNCFVGYDYRFHYPVTLSLQDLPGKIITTVHQTTGLQRFQPSSWSKVQRFKVQMPNQPNGSGSCGVGVVFYILDICNGFQRHFTWTFNESTPGTTLLSYPQECSQSLHQSS